MEKVKVFTLALCLLLVSGSSSYSVLAAEDNIHSYYSNEWINEEGEYEFPANIESESWNKLGTVVQMRAATQIPDEILKTITTEDLIILIEKYPLLCDLHAYGSLAEGYNSVKAEFNGITELLTRSDCFSELIEAYVNYKIPATRIMDYDNLLSPDNYVNDFNKLIQDEKYRNLILADCGVYNTVDILEMLILDAIDESTKNIDIFVKTYSNKLIEKNNSEYYDEAEAASLLNFLISENSVLADEFEIKSSSDTAAPLSYYTIYTPSGTPVSCTYNTNTSYADPSTYAGDIIAYHASLVSIASITFNCHSFAWLQSLYPSVYQYLWLNSVSPFSSDPYYTMEYTPSAAGRIANWSTHSAIVTIVSQNNPYNYYIPEPYLISKWGPGPIVAHYQSLCPYYYGDTVYYYY